MMLAGARDIDLGEDQNKVDSASLTQSQSRENRRSVCTSAAYAKNAYAVIPILRHSAERGSCKEFLFQHEGIIVG